MARKKDKKKISINANPAGTLEIHEYFNRLAQTKKKPVADKRKEQDKD